MKGLKKLSLALLIVGLIGSLSIIGAAQFLSIPADTPAMQALTEVLDAVPFARAGSRKLGEILVFTDRESVTTDIEASPTVSHPPAAAPAPAPTPTPTPTPKGLQLPRPTPGGPNWGLVTATEARSFTTKGKPRDRIRAGTALAVLAQKKTSIGECLECNVAPANPGKIRFLVLRKDVLMFGGSPADIPAEAQSLLVAKAKALAAMKQLEVDAEGAHRKKNPNYARYQTARADYLAYWKKVKSIQAARDSTAGGGHVNAEDELRQLKGEDVRVGTAYETAKAAYEAWKSTHPVPSVSSTLRYHGLQAQVDALDEKIAAVPPSS